MLRDRYYLGYVCYQGEEFEGRHKHLALVSPETFARVQEHLTSRGGGSGGIRQRIHHHYLKGLLWCGACHDEGRESRMIVQRSIGAGGQEYFYFFCRGKQEHVCSSRYVDTDLIEEFVEAEYHGLKVAPGFCAFMRRQLAEALADRDRSVKLRRGDLTIQLDRLDRKEANLLDLRADGEMTTPVVRSKLAEINDQRVELTKELGEVDSGLDAAVELIEAAIDLLEEPHALYSSMGPEQRRLFNRAVFVKLYIYEDRIGDREYQEPFTFLIPAGEAFAATSSPWGAESVPQGDDLLLVGAEGRPNHLDRSWSKTKMVEAMGLEPTNLLTASHVSGVREGSAAAAIGALPGISVQRSSHRFSRIRPRCLHNCLHFPISIFPKSTAQLCSCRPAR
jgi:hypothetical protein